MKKKKKLFNSLLIIPPVSILMVFIFVAIIFHVVMKSYITDITADSISEEFESRFIDTTHSTKFSLDMDNNIYFPVHTIITKPNEDPYSFIGDWYTDREKIEAEEILNEVAMKETWKDEKISVNIGEQSYIVGRKFYEGYFDGYFIFDEGSPKDLYEVITYINTTSVQSIVKLMDKFIVVLFTIFAGLSVLLISLHLRRINISFRNLNKYLIKVGKREKNIEKADVLYEEFESVVDTIDHMSDLIDKSEQLQKNFFQNASHELRTPLMSIQGYTEGIMHDVINKEKGLEVIYNQSQKMSKLVDDILYLSKFENKEIKEKKVDIAGIIYESTNNISFSNGKNLEFKINLPDDLEFIGDEELIEKVFDNIISNAQRYAKHTIKIDGTKLENLIKVEITDDGDGIDSSEIGHIFERFYKGKGGNFGIGLSLVKDIMKRYGDVYVSSKEGETTFTLEFRT
ncbi:Signal transduction histidine kinase [Peptoniphilus asaccharolyticus DSM 20463]|uniref:histidine kinase n=1 Tax=Peptoniphilus asaccharolyticus DSM 20463 TaxID=573058 RepID=A0A1W1UHH7_PEPAS|nr:HAMP domain-containing sensor histidine kinase [Peptoniphilus asaccharolyticus]MBL7574693.1 HAMP domain-containing histidine kinase [Peptoniphilus asaccharolyticus]SMB80214.1 Signal transduction histidine kinase [Peptoniphilus asaccharolyticus DSM 20463]